MRVYLEIRNLPSAYFSYHYYLLIYLFIHLFIYLFIYLLID